MGLILSAIILIGIPILITMFLFYKAIQFNDAESLFKKFGGIVLFILLAYLCSGKIALFAAIYIVPMLMFATCFKEKSKG